MQPRIFAPAQAAWSSLIDHGVRLALAALILLGAAWLQEARAADDFLEPDKAFQFSARALDDKSVEVNYQIAPGYYLYREQFKFAANGATLGTPVIPPGKVKYDATFEKNVETYRDHIRIVVPVEQAGAEFRLVVTSQGCADAGLCYPPQQAAAAVGLVAFGGSGTARIDTSGGGPPGAGGTSSSPSAAIGAAAPAADATGVEAVLRGGSFWPVVGAFFIAGLLLSLTPCVLPMLPIVSSIIVGHGGYEPSPAGARTGASAA